MLWAVLTIVSTSSIISFCLFLLLDLTASTKQHDKCHSNNCKLTDLSNHITARFCWIIFIQYSFFSVIIIILSNSVLAFLSAINCLASTIMIVNNLNVLYLYQRYWYEYNQKKIKSKRFFIYDYIDFKSVLYICKSRLGLYWFHNIFIKLNIQWLL